MDDFAVNKKLSLKKLDVGWPSSREYHELVWGILAAEHETPDKASLRSVKTHLNP